MSLCTSTYRTRMFLHHNGCISSTLLDHLILVATSRRCHDAIMVLESCSSVRTDLPDTDNVHHLPPLQPQWRL